MKKVIATYEWGTDLESLIKALQNVQNFVPDGVPDYAISVDADPRKIPNMAGKVRVIEEKLTDGSLVYNVDLFG